MKRKNLTVFKAIVLLLLMSFPSVGASAAGSYGITEDGKCWESSGLTSPVVLTTDESNPVYYYIKTVNTGRYIGVTDSLTLAPLAQSATPTNFYFMSASDGGILIKSEGGKIIAFEASGNSYKQYAKGADTDTWTFLYRNDAVYPGYTISATTTTVKLGQLWGNTSGYYTQRAWSTPAYMYSSNGKYYCSNLGYGLSNSSNAQCYSTMYVFCSSDKRHVAYLNQNNIPVSHIDTYDDVASGANKYIQSLTINNQRAVYATYLDRYFVTIPKKYIDGSDYAATVNFSMNSGYSGYTLYINDTKVDNGGSYTFKGSKCELPYYVRVFDGDKCLAKEKLNLSTLPIVEITSTSVPAKSITSDEYSPNGSFKVLVNYAPEDGSSFIADTAYAAKFKVHGGTSTQYTKKSFTMKLLDSAGESMDKQLIGLREDNGWILNAMDADNVKMKDSLSTDLWNAFSAKPYQCRWGKEDSSKVVNGTRGKFVEVIMNGQYYGLYCMNEQVDRKQLKLKKLIEGTTSATDTIRGTLWKAKNFGTQTQMGINGLTAKVALANPDSVILKPLSAYNNTSSTWGAWEVKEPDIDDNEPITWAPLYAAANISSSAADKAFCDSVGTYFDMPVWRDYKLLMEVTFATDNAGKNMYAWCYNQNSDNAQYGKMISCTPWDLDGTWGVRWDSSVDMTSYVAKGWDTMLWNRECGEHQLLRRLKITNARNFNKNIAARYCYLRQTLLHPDSLSKRFTDYENLLLSSGAHQREFDRWDYVNTKGGYGYECVDVPAQVSKVLSFIKYNMAHLDTEYGYDATKTYENPDKYDPEMYGNVVKATGLTVDKTTAEVKVGSKVQLTAVIANADASYQNVIWTSSNTKIATVDNNGTVKGKKVGTAVITATTKDGSNLKATCTVNVSATTGIQNVVNEKSKSTVTYSISGIKYSNVKALKPGLYIINGKKVVVR